MLWIQASVILGSFLYIVLTILNYTGVLSDIRPRIIRGRERSRKLEEAIEAEKKLDGMVQAQVEAERIGLTEVKLAVAEAKQETRALEARERAIKQEFFKRGLPIPQ